MKPYSIGIDIGGTNTKCGIVDQQGEVLEKEVIPTNVHRNIDVYLNEVHETILGLLKKCNKTTEDIHGIGIGAPNANMNTGTLEHATNLPWKGVIPFQRKIEDLFGLRAVITNDANAAAIGEMTYGKAQGLTDFMVVTLGTGLGSGFVCNGNLIYGHDGFAGDFGHVKVKYDERECGCGKKGCLETYVSATGICRTAHKLLADFKDYPTKLRDLTIKEITAKMIHELAQEGDPVALAAFEKTGRILGQKLADAVHMLSPSHIFLMGGLSHAGYFLIPHIKNYMEPQLMSAFANKVQIEVTGLDEKVAPILGAASLAKTYLS